MREISAAETTFCNPNYELRFHDVQPTRKYRDRRRGRRNCSACKTAPTPPQMHPSTKWVGEKNVQSICVVNTTVSHMYHELSSSCRRVVFYNG